MFSTTYLKKIFIRSFLTLLCAVSFSENAISQHGVLSKFSDELYTNRTELYHRRSDRTETKESVVNLRQEESRKLDSEYLDSLYRDVLDKIGGKGRVEYFESDGNIYILINDFKEKRSTIYTTEGEIVSNRQGGEFHYENGVMTEYVFDKHHTSNIYTFPELQKIDSLVHRIHGLDDFILLAEHGGVKYRLYYKGKLINRFKTKNGDHIALEWVNSGFGLSFISLKHVKKGMEPSIQLSRVKRARDSAIWLFTEEGIPVYHSKYQRYSKEVQFISASGLFKIRKHTTDGEMVTTMIYDSVTKTTISLDNSIQNRMTDNLFVASEKGKMGFTDKNAGPVNDNQYERILVYTCGKAAFAEVEKENYVFSVFNTQLQQVCDSCSITAEGGYMSPGKGARYMIIYFQNLNRFKICNENFEWVYPDYFLAAAYNEQSKNIAVLTEDHKIIYLSLAND